MTRLRLALFGVVVMLFMTAVPASAITYGQPDNGEHPYVGFMIFFDPSAPGWFSCTGTLLDSTTFLTAGHCTFGIGTDFENEGNTGGTDVWVTFDDTEVLAGWPARADFPDEKTLYDARRAWLESHGYVQGTAFPNPDYDNFADFPANHDVGVVVLDDSVSMDTYGVLADLGTIDAAGGVSQEPEPGAHRDGRLRDPVGPAEAAGRRHPLQVDVADRGGDRQHLAWRQRPHAQQPERCRRPRRFVLR